MQIIIFGAPGVGKGTQAKIIAAQLNIAHISTGDILREAIKKETELGQKAKIVVEKGELVPDDIMGGIISDTLKEDRCKNGFILDGFPRTIAQAQILTSIFIELNLNKLFIIKLNVDDKIIIDRLTNRLVCNNCGNIIAKNEYTGNFKCPVCKSIESYYKRKDDDEEVIKRRLKVYHDTTAPVFNYYKDNSNVIEVNGTKQIDEVTKNILTKLN